MIGFDGFGFFSGYTLQDGLNSVSNNRKLRL